MSRIAISLSLLFIITGSGLSQSPLNRVYDLLDQQQYVSAMAVVDSLIEADGRNRRTMQAKYYIFDAMGSLNEALAAAKKAEELNEKKSPWDCIAIVKTYLKLSDSDKAMTWLETAVDRGFKSFKVLSDSLYDPIRDTEKFSVLVSKIKTGIGMDRPAKEIDIELLDGKPFRLSEQKGKVMIVDFWATWCAPCRAEMPNLKKIYTEHGENGLEILGISLDSDREKLTDYIKKEQLSWNFAYSGKAWDDPDAKNYGVNSIPSVWIIDKKGILRDFDVRGEALEVLVKRLIQEQ